MDNYVLIVEDNLLQLNDLTNLIKNMGFNRVFTANSYAKALYCINNYCIDIGLVDINLGNTHNPTEGIDLIIEVKKNTTDFSFIYISGNITESVVKKALTPILLLF
jgi:YesN/AraC family two-component response regulator